jgi:hypothetical protein
MPKERDAYVRVMFPSGGSFCVRADRSGIVFNADGVWIDEELAANMLFIKIWKLELAEPAGRC